jgi:hypothetical protein
MVSGPGVLLKASYSNLRTLAEARDVIATAVESLKEG